MSLFKNENETAFTGGRKHFTDVIKNTGEGNLLVWKQPEEDFNTNSTLIVMPGETAIFVNNGTIEQTFTNGRYKLSTSNYPFISRLRNAFSGGISTFNCVVYFVRDADSKEILWGSDSPIPVRDKKYDIVTYVRARGAYKIHIDNPEILLKKLLGSNVRLLGQEELDEYFVNSFSGIIKSTVSDCLNSYEQEMIGLEAHLLEFSQQIQPQIDVAVRDYGLSCVSFILSALDFDHSRYDDIDQKQIDSYIDKVKTAQGNKAAMDILGSAWGQQQAANILNNLAQNPGAGGIGAAGAGMGMGFAAGNVFGDMARQMFAPLGGQNLQQQQPSPPSTQAVSSRFAPKNSPQRQDNPASEGKEDIMETLGKLKQLLDAGFITQEDYEKKKTEILSRM